MRLCVALVAFLLIPMASAFAAPSSDSSSQASPSEPRLKRILPTCDSYLPSGNEAARIDGRTALRFDLSPEGELRDGAITFGSGNDVLDAAALACAENSGVKFNMQNGSIAPAVVPALVQWTHNAHSSLIVICPFQYASIKLNEQGVVGLTLHIAKDGTVSSAVMTKSSGFKRVDNSALACAYTFRYEPPTHEGIPVEADQKLNLDLRNR